MIDASSISTPNPLVRVSYVLLIAVLSIGTMILPFGPRAALLAAAVIFGWSQIGGL
jgi:hypothetical protein